MAAGVVVGAVLAIGNVYLGLKTGWGDTGNITASVLGFAAFGWVSRRGAPYGRLENNLTQATASAAAVMVFVAGLISILPALELMGRPLPAVPIVGGSVCLGLIGLALSTALRRRYVEEDALPFPSGVATAEVIEAMHRAAGEALGRARILLASGLASVAAVWLRDGRPTVIPGAVMFPGSLGGAPAASLNLGVSVSPMLLGAGMLVGLRQAASLCAGAFVAWVLLAPRLLEGGIVAKAEHGALIGWLLWPGIALMASASLASLLGDWRVIGRAFRGWRRTPSPARPAADGRWVFWLVLVAAIVGAVIFTSVAFGLHPGWTLGALALSLVLSVVCARAAGETDIQPITQMGQITQLLFGGLGRLPGASNVAAGGVVAGVAAGCTNPLLSFKVGHRFGSDPWRLTLAQAVGVAAGALVAVPTYFLVARAYGLGSAQLPAPTALAYKAIAEVAHVGTSAMPPGALAAALVAAVLGVVLALGGKTRAARLLPAPVAMGVGFLVPALYTTTMAVGALLLVALRRRDPAQTDRLAPSAAAGAIAGEALTGVFIAILIITGVLRR